MLAKSRYRVDLPGHLAECDANYYRLIKLMPSLFERDSWRFSVGCSETVTINVRERSRYTTTVVVQQQAASAWLPMTSLTVRLYHDATMAEVLAWEGYCGVESCNMASRNIRPRYDYPNRQMYQADEKAQLNRFLGEWLNHCLANGRVKEDMITLGIED